MTDNLKFEVRTITPDEAASLLEDAARKGVANVRKTKQNVVAAYAKDMLLGRWVMTGEAIQFDVNGDLRNGFHRLQACVLAGVPFTTLVVMGVSVDAVHAMDWGTPRSVAGQLAGEIRNANAVEAIARLYLAYMAGITIVDKARSSAEITKSMIRDCMLGNREEFEEAAKIGSRVRSAVGASPSVSGVFWVLASEIDPDEATRFFELLISGANLSADDPIMALRTWSTSRLARGIKPNQEVWMLAFSRAWNKWRRGESLGKLIASISGKGSSRTPMPPLV